MLRNKKLLIVIITSSMFVALFAMIINSENTRTLPGNVLLNGVSLSGMDRRNARAEVEKITDALEKKTYSIAIGGVAQVFTPSELGIQYDVSRTLTSMFDRESWLMGMLAYSQEETDSSPGTFSPSLRVNEGQLTNVIDAVLGAQERDYQDAQIVWSDKNWIMMPSAPGNVLKEGERERIRLVILELAKNSQVLEELVPEYESVAPLVNTEDLEPLLADLRQLIADPFVLVFSKERTELNMKDHDDWVSIDPLTKSFSLNEDFARRWVHGYVEARNEKAGQVIVTALEEVVSEYDGKSYKKAVFTGDFTKGKNIDEQKIFNDLKVIFMEPAREKKITVEWEVLRPEIVSLIAGVQFPQLLSTGVSSFRFGNHANRVTNIKLSLATLKGVVIEPQEEFSFNRVTGYITPEKGYTKTQVIMLGKVEDGVGGGVCQTSTTVYRSMLNAGFPVTERRNHTLDIIYYHEFGYGQDATVYADSHNDLKFINDFPGPVLINSYTDDSSTEAVVEFYGVTDQRRVELANVPTGNSLIKKWDWKIIWPDREELRSVESRYALPKEEEEKPLNPLEG